MSFWNKRVTYHSGPFVIRLQSDYRPLLDLLGRFYTQDGAHPKPDLAHFHLRVGRVRGLRRWHRPQVRFFVDGTSPFEPFPLDHAFPLLEWGLNWCIAMRAHQYLMLHSGAVEKNGLALILPALPGSGKSTLTAALVSRGWRLLSDEFGLVRPETGKMIPLPRAIPLKNESIGVIREFAPDAWIGPVFPKTRKGPAAHKNGPALAHGNGPSTGARGCR